MPIHNILDLMALAAAIAVGRSNLKKQTIADQAALITAMERNINQLKEQNRVQEERIRCLEEMVNGNSELVEGRPVATSHRAGGGKRATSPKATKNGDS